MAKNSDRIIDFLRQRSVQTNVPVIQRKMQLEKSIAEHGCPKAQGGKTYIRSLIKINGRLTKSIPQVCLNCHYREFLRYPDKIVYEADIKLLCADPNYAKKCPAYREFQIRSDKPFITQETPPTR